MIHIQFSWLHLFWVQPWGKSHGLLRFKSVTESYRRGRPSLFCFVTAEACKIGTVVRKSSHTYCRKNDRSNKRTYKMAADWFTTVQNDANFDDDVHLNRQFGKIDDFCFVFSQYTFSEDEIKSALCIHTVKHVGFLFTCSAFNERAITNKPRNQTV